MEEKQGTSLEEIFQELQDIHEALSKGISALGVLEKGAESLEMADALGIIAGYLHNLSDDVGSLARIGERCLAGNG